MLLSNSWEVTIAIVLKCMAKHCTDHFGSLALAAQDGDMVARLALADALEECDGFPSDSELCAAIRAI